MSKGITIKTAEEIEVIKQGGRILARVLREVTKQVKPGATTGELDELAEKLIRQAGGEPSFKGFAEKNSPPFPTTLCASINNEVVHAPALPSRVLKNGDLLKIDIGMKYPNAECRMQNVKFIDLKQEFYTDMAITVAVGKINKKAEKLLRVTREALQAGIKKVKPGGRLSEIGKAVQGHAEKNGFSVVRALVGHGVGYAVHEAPEVPNFWPAGMQDYGLKQGMVICIEPMVNAGACQVSFKPGEWAVRTSDNSLSAHFEHTIIVTKNGAEVATK